MRSQNQLGIFNRHAKADFKPSTRIVSKVTTIVIDCDDSTIPNSTAVISRIIKDFNTNSADIIANKIM